MRWSNKSLKMAATISVIVLMGLAVVVYVGSGLFEAEDVRRGSINYFLGLPTSVRTIPLIEECQEPVYRWRGRDGASSPHISATYGSRSSPQNILGFYKKAMSQLSCSPQTEPINQPNNRTVVKFSCSGPDILSIDVWVENEAACRSVTLDIIEGY
jgi:hypothetical protein